MAEKYLLWHSSRGESSFKDLTILSSYEKTMTGITKGLCKTREIDAAMMLVRDCLANVTSGPMEFKYTLSVVHACKSGGAEKVIEVLT